MSRLLMALVAGFMFTTWTPAPVQAQYQYCVTSCQDKANTCAIECNEKLGASVSECQLACARVLFVSCVKRCSSDGVVVEDDYEIRAPEPSE
jgi:hypothetical protein